MEYSIQGFLFEAALIIPAFLVALSVHEFAHAGMAVFLGDDTPKRHGRLSLNPLVHIDPLGFLFLLFFRIGWAKPVFFDRRNFKYPKLYSIFTAFAGPISNFIVAILAFLLLKFMPYNLVPYYAQTTFIQLFQIIAQINVMLGVFNMLPIPPLDGSHLLTALLVDKFPQFIFWLQRYSIFMLMFLLIAVPHARIFLFYAIMWVYHLLHSLVF